MEARLDRYRGAMAGLAVGDALGAPVEGLKQGRIKQVYGRIEDLVDPWPAFRNKPSRWRMPGLYTDDTQQALVLADTLVKCYGFDAEYFSRLLVEMSRAIPEKGFGAFRGTGRNFRDSVGRLAGGEKPLMAGALSAGIGAAMRVAPAGLYYADSREDLIKASVEQGLVTGRDPRALEAACAVAFCVGQGAKGIWREQDPEQRIESLLMFMDEAAHAIKEEYMPYLPLETWDHFGRFAAALKGLKFYVNMERNMVWKNIVNEANRGFPESKISDPSQGFSMAGCVTAIFLGIVSRAYSEGVEEAINLGRDTDSVAAITGAMIGAREGLKNIPDTWRKKVINLDQVILRGDALWQLSYDGLMVEDIVEMEKRLTLKEMEERRMIMEKSGLKDKPGKDSTRKKPAEIKPATQAEKEEIDKKEKRKRIRKLGKPKKIKSPWRGGNGFE